MKAPLVLLLLVSVTSVVAQGPARIEITKTIDSVNKISSELAIEKLYIQTDKSSYAVNDTLWFKAYLLDAAYLTASSKSGLLYIEIVNDENALVKRMMVPVYTGMAFGQFELNEKEYGQGNYTLRAYTNWMRNFRENYIFKKEFVVYGLDSVSLKTVEMYQKVTDSKSSRVPPVVYDPSTIDVQFMPEGGELVNSIISKVGFKALNQFGYSTDVSGVIVDSKGKEITKFSSLHKGIGSFSLLPEAGEKYTAKVNLPNGSFKNYPLPPAKSSGFVLHVNNGYDKDSCEVWVYASPDLVGTDRVYYFFGQARGIICFGAAVKMKNNFMRYVLAKSLFPTGITHLTLNDGNMRTICERLIYIDNKDELKIDLNTDKELYNRRDSVAISVRVTDNNGSPVQGTFSLAVTDDSQVKVDSVSDHSINSWVLMANDVKGNIEDPGYYIDPSHWKELDNLLLTQGWTGYDLNEMSHLKQNITHPAEQEFVIRGRVMNAFNKPVSGSRVVLMGKKPMLVIDTLTNEKGVFEFKDIIPSDTAIYFLQSRNKKNKEFNVGIELEEFKSPVFAVSRQRIVPFYSKIDSTSVNKQAGIRKEFERVTGVKTLQEVVVEAKMRIQDSKNLNGPGEADLIIGEEELKKAGNTTLGDLVAKRVEGFTVRVSKSGYRYYAINAMILHLIIDGMDVAFSRPEGVPIYDYFKQYFDYYDASDIKGIEVMRSLGYQGRYTFRYVDPLAKPYEHAFLEVTTRSGHGPFVKKTPGTFLYRPLPFNVPRKFYVPKYTPASVPDMSDVRSTVFWEPDIITNKDGRATVRFYTADVPGSYTLIIEGSDLNGNVGTKRENIKIAPPK